MNRLELGLWDLADVSLRWLGKGAIRLLIRKPISDDEGIAYALLGGALVGIVFGGVAGFGLSDHSQRMVTMEGAILGILLGACTGVFFGSFIEAVDETINDVLRSLKPK